MAFSRSLRGPRDLIDAPQRKGTFRGVEFISGARLNAEDAQRRKLEFERLKQKGALDLENRKQQGLLDVAKSSGAENLNIVNRRQKGLLDVTNAQNTGNLAVANRRQRGAVDVANINQDIAYDDATALRRGQDLTAEAAANRLDLNRSDKLATFQEKQRENRFNQFRDLYKLDNPVSDSKDLPIGEKQPSAFNREKNAAFKAWGAYNQKPSAKLAIQRIISANPGVPFNELKIPSNLLNAYRKEQQAQ